ncbi:hypothetical protein [Streptomyces sp. NPDC017949]|uniref:hypothetical protein n=1 Tax=Streptomyces sp. NPDC017949 TaxID=3365020 RepID=UPI0037AD3693
MADLGTFITQDFGSVASAVVALLAIPGVILAGHIQGSKALRGAQAQAENALEAAREQAAATLETGRLQAQAALASARELSREAHAQWQRDRCQEAWAEFVKELDLLLPKRPFNDEEARIENLLKAYALVELMSPPSVLANAHEAKDGAVDFATALHQAHMQNRNHLDLRRAKRELRATVRAAARLSQTPGGGFIEEVPDGTGEWAQEQPESEDEFQEMAARYEASEAAHAALEALDAAEQAPGEHAVEDRACQALMATGLREQLAGRLASTACWDYRAQREIRQQKRTTLSDLRSAFVEAARTELDALGR